MGIKILFRRGGGAVEMGEKRERYLCAMPVSGRGIAHPTVKPIDAICYQGATLNGGSSQHDLKFPPA